jgi:aminomethyltransferase
LALYGNELTDETTPLEAGLDRWVALDKGDFLGRDALLRQRAAGLTRKLVGLQVTGRGIARHGYGIHRATAQTTAYETATEPVRSAGEPAGGDGSTGRGGAGPGAGVSAPQVTPVAAGSQGEARSPQPLGSTIGEITSGAPSPTLEYPIALGYVAISASATGTELLVDCRGKPTAARVVSGPFYRRGR